MVLDLKARRNPRMQESPPSQASDYILGEGMYGSRRKFRDLAEPSDHGDRYLKNKKYPDVSNKTQAALSGVYRTKAAQCWTSLRRVMSPKENPLADPWDLSTPRSSRQKHPGSTQIRAGVVLPESKTNHAVATNLDDPAKIQPAIPGHWEAMVDSRRMITHRVVRRTGSCSRDQDRVQAVSVLKLVKPKERNTQHTQPTSRRRAYHNHLCVNNNF